MPNTNVRRRENKTIPGKGKEIKKFGLRWKVI